MQKVLQRLGFVLVGSTLSLAPVAHAANPIDAQTRNVLRLTQPNARHAASQTSDYLVGTLVSYPFIVDGVQMIQGQENAFQTFAMDAGAFAVNGAMTLLTKNLLPRNRPYEAECESNNGYDEGCGTSDSHKSFFSGHTSWAFTGAGLACSKDVYGDKLDKTVCATALGLATTTGVLRIAADKHHATDVLVGAAVGLFSGYLLPTLLKSNEEDKVRDEPGAAIAPMIGKDSQFGLTAQFHF